jgi:hypothetical protein
MQTQRRSSGQIRCKTTLNGGAAEFLRAALADGEVPVGELEVRARAAGLLGERQRITDAKVFKLIKKKLGIKSHRDGFGRGGEWFWALPITSNTELVETVADLVPKMPGLAVNDDHSRPEQLHSPAQRATTGVASALIEPTPIRRVPPEWTRGVAWLRQQRRPADVPRHRWQLFLDDCERFLDQREDWAERAANLGWDAAALFGCDRQRPLDQPGAGLLWRVGGGSVIAIHRDWAAIETNGVQHTVHRRPSAPNITLPWSLR